MELSSNFSDLATPFYHNIDSFLVLSFDMLHVELTDYCKQNINLPMKRAGKIEVEEIERAAPA